MKRKDFLQKGLSAGALMGSAAYLTTANHSQASHLPEAASPSESNQSPADGQPSVTSDSEEIFIERPQSGKPHRGKVLAAIQPHSDDIPLFAGGTVAKLLNEGYTGYLIRTSNDEKAGRGETLGESIVNDETDNRKIAEAYGMKGVYDLYYRNHQMDNYGIQELKARLIYLFRLLKVDTIVSYDPWGHYEENPDHYVTARAVEAARWMSGNRRNYPEHFDGGLEPHSVMERYYFARGPQKVNRVVDISNYIDKKVEINLLNVTQGPAGENGSRLRRRLQAEGKRLAILGDNDRSANFNYAKHFVFDRASRQLRGVPSDREIGQRYGLEWAEQFHYIGRADDALGAYIDENAENL